jgi:hypothetical protein
LLPPSRPPKLPKSDARITIFFVLVIVLGPGRNGFGLILAARPDGRGTTDGLKSPSYVMDDLLRRVGMAARPDGRGTTDGLKSPSYVMDDLHRRVGIAARPDGRGTTDGLKSPSYVMDENFSVGWALLPAWIVGVPRTG